MCVKMAAISVKLTQIGSAVMPSHIASHCLSATAEFLVLYIHLNLKRTVRVVVYVINQVGFKVRFNSVNGGSSIVRDASRVGLRRRTVR